MHNYHTPKQQAEILWTNGHFSIPTMTKELAQWGLTLIARAIQESIEGGENQYDVLCRIRRELAEDA